MSSKIFPILAAAATIAFLYAPGPHFVSGSDVHAEQSNPDPTKTSAINPSEPPSVDLSEKQLSLLKIARLESKTFKIEKTTIGAIDFNQDRAVQIFTPYQGRIIAVFVKLDDAVKAGQPLFTVESADLLQAESTLLQTAGVYELTSHALARLRKLIPAGGGAQKDLEQAISDQQTAEGNLKSARNALHVFGKDEAEIDRIIADRVIDGTLMIKSPSDGVVGARNAAPGLFLQPSSTPAALTIADIKTKWMVASAGEADSGAVHLGQAVAVQVLALPNRVYGGRITAIGESIDTATRRFMVRSEIDDPDNALRPGMFANFVISTGSSLTTLALPTSGAVREGDGTMTAWVTQNRRHFTQRIVKLGLQQNGAYQVIDGLHEGELVVVDGAVFLNNILEAPPSD